MTTAEAPDFGLIETVVTFPITRRPRRVQSG